MIERALGYHCTACRAFVTEWLGPACTACGARSMAVGFPPSLAAPEAQVASLGDVTELAPRRKTNVGPLDHVLAGGAVQGHAIVLFGDPSAGKTSLCLELLSKAEAPLFFSAEMHESEVVRRAQALELPYQKIRFTRATELGAIEKIILDEQPSDIVLDSLAFVHDETRTTASDSPWMLKEAARRLARLSHGLSVTAWMIVHANKRRQAAGPVSVLHYVDVALRIIVQKDGTRTLTSTKNRAGPTGLSAMLVTKDCDLPGQSKEDLGITKR